MGIAKVVYIDENNQSTTWVDLTSDTVASGNLLSPETATGADGEAVTGSIATKTGADLAASGATVTVPAGYYATNASKSVASGSAATPATSITANPTISVNSSTGVITATTSASQSVTPTVSAGYVSSGTAGTVSVSGSNTESLTTQAAQTIYPSTSDQSIASGKYLTGAQTIKGVLLTNLSADNIKKDVVVKVGDSADDDRITAVTGTYEGGGGGGGGGATPVETGVQFIDYDGTLVETWESTDVSGKSALPSNPSHTGLTAQGWNWTLADIKSYIQSCPEALLTVGQMYVTTSGATEIDITLADGRLAPYLGTAVNGSINVDWGDGSTHDTITGSSLTTEIYTLHAYAAPGEYTIKITVNTGSFAFRFSSTTKGLLSKNSNTAFANRLYNAAVNAVRLGSNVQANDYAFSTCIRLKYVTIPNTITKLESGAFYQCYLLEALVVPNNVTYLSSQLLYFCHGLQYVAIPNSVTQIRSSSLYGADTLPAVSFPLGASFSTYTQIAYQCYCLRNVTLPNMARIPDNSFYNCYGLPNITIPSVVTTINAGAFQNCYGLGEIHFKPTTPPTVVNSNAFTNVPTDCTIYVPYSADHSVLNSYTTASNYPSSGTYTYVEE